MREPRVFPELKLTIMERPAYLRISADEYDDEGNIIGPNPDYHKQLEEWKDHIFYRVVAVADMTLEGSNKFTPHTIAVDSAVFKPMEKAGNPLERAHLNEATKMVIYSFLKRLLPDEPK